MLIAFVMRCHLSSAGLIAPEGALDVSLSWGTAVVASAGRYTTVPLGAGGRGGGEGRSGSELGRSDVLQAHVQCPRGEPACLRRKGRAPAPALNLKFPPAPPRRCLTFTAAAGGGPRRDPSAVHTSSTRRLLP